MGMKGRIYFYLVIALLTLTMPVGHSTEIDCASIASKAQTFSDRRAWVRIADLCIYGLPRLDEGTPESADVLIWKTGEAKWSKKAARKSSGAVVVMRLIDGDWNEISRLKSPQPAAYGRFGARLAAGSTWLVVLENRHEGELVWIFDLDDLDSSPTELEDTRGFARAVAVVGDQILVGGQGEARLYKKGVTWSLAERVQAPPHSEGVFTGHVASEGGLLVSTANGLDLGDGFALPGRVDVFRRSAHGWIWEAKLSPTAADEGYGQDCCVSIKHESIIVTVREETVKFTKVAEYWQPSEVRLDE